MTEQTERRPLVERLAAGSPARVGQATAVEQSRAVAEVLASVELALRMPRDPVVAVETMRRACGIKGLAERAFFSYRRLGSNITGPTVHLARELARCFRNIAYGVAELDRDDAGGQSQVIAFAWDIEANVRSSTVFVVPHARDVDGKVKPLTSLRDVYENNANAAARRVREQIFAVLPQWYVDEAVALCRDTLTTGGGVPLERRIATLVSMFDERFRVSQAQLVEHLGRPADKWTPTDVVTLEVLGRSLSNGEQHVDEVFTVEATSSAIRQQAERSRRQQPAAAPPVVEDPPGGDPGEEHDPTLEPDWPGEQS